MKSPPIGFGLLFLFPYANLTIMYLHKDALTQESVENHRNRQVCERSNGSEIEIQAEVRHVDKWCHFKGAKVALQILQTLFIVEYNKKLNI